MSAPLIPDPALTVDPTDAPLPSVPVVTTPPIPYIYIGPNSPTIGAYSLTIYPELPDNIQQAIAANPALNVLFPTLDQWRNVKSLVISKNGNMNFSGSVAHAVKYLKSVGAI